MSTFSFPFVLSNKASDEKKIYIPQQNVKVPNNNSTIQDAVKIYDWVISSSNHKITITQ